MKEKTKMRLLTALTVANLGLFATMLGLSGMVSS